MIYSKKVQVNLAHTWKETEIKICHQQSTSSNKINQLKINHLNNIYNLKEATSKVTWIWILISHHSSNFGNKMSLMLYFSLFQSLCLVILGPLNLHIKR